MGYKGSREVFGYPPHRCYDLIYMLEKELGTKFSVLIPNCYDGYCVMPMILREKIVDCYETNDILINYRIISNKQDLLFLEEKFSKVFNETHYNVYNCFISYTELTENQYPFYIMQFELLLSNYFYEDDNNHDCLTIAKKDMDSCYYNDTKTLDIYNLKKDHIEKILKWLILLQKDNIHDKRIDKLIKNSNCIQICLKNN